MPTSANHWQITSVWRSVLLTDDMQQAFDKMHVLMAADALVAYPDHNKWFDIYTDASDFQLDAYIVQEGRPVAYFSCKLSKSTANQKLL